MKMSKEQMNVITKLREANVDEDIITRVEIFWSHMYQMGYEYGYNDALKDLNRMSNNED